MTLLGQEERTMSLRIPLGIHDYATGKKIQKNFNMVSKNGGRIELRGRGLRNIWMKDKEGNFKKVANGQTLPLQYAKKVAVYLVYNGDDTYDTNSELNIKKLIKGKIKEVKKRSIFNFFKNDYLTSLLKGSCVIFNFNKPGLYNVIGIEIKVEQPYLNVSNSIPLLSITRVSVRLWVAVPKSMT